MYWTSGKATSPTNLDTLYGKGVAGLDEVLDVDNIILRARNGEDRLLGYLSGEKVIGRLVIYTLGQDLMGEQAIRYPLVACELLTCDHITMQTALRNHFQYLRCLWRLAPKPTGPQLACWSRLIIYLVTRLPEIVTKSLQSDSLKDDKMAEPTNINNGEDESVGGQFVTAIVHALIRPEVAEVALRLFSIPELIEFWKRYSFFPLLFKYLLEETSSQEEISDFPSTCRGFLYNLLNNNGWPFGITNPSNKILGKAKQSLLKMMIYSLQMPLQMEELSTSTFAVLCDILSLLIKRVTLESDLEIQSKLVIILLKIIPSLCAIIVAPSSSQYTSSRGSVEVIGLKRIKSIYLLADTLLLGDEAIMTRLIEGKMVCHLIDFIFRQAHNSILLAAIVQFASRTLSHPTINQPLIDEILRKGQLIRKILKNQRLNDAKMYQRREARLENMGHVTILVDELLKYSENHDEEDLGLITIENEQLDDELKEDWQDYLDSAYRETKLRDGHVLGGSKAPSPPELAEEVPLTINHDLGDSIASTNSFTSFFAMNSDEQLARYFCQQVLNSIPDRFVVNSISSEVIDQHVKFDKVDNNEGGKSNHDGSVDVTIPMEASIEIPVDGGGLDDVALEMEMRQSSLSDDNYDGDDLEDSNRDGDEEIAERDKASDGMVNDRIIRSGSSTFTKPSPGDNFLEE